MKSKQLLSLLAVAAVVFCADSKVYSRSISSQKIFETYSPLVYRVQTSTGANLDKESYGSSFVVSRDGLLLTNFHVVIEGLSGVEGNKIFARIDGKLMPARVLDIDIVNDLALLRVNTVFRDSLHFASGKTADGETIYSIGFPQDLNPSIIQGNFNGIRRSGPYELVQLSAPLNFGMSGGPILNSAGQVIGVNESILANAQSISFCVPSSRVQKFIQSALQSEKPMSWNMAIHKISHQVQEIQTNLKTEFDHDSGERLEFGGWKIRKPPSFLQCWTRAETKGQKRFEELRESCASDHEALIWPSIYSGNFQESVDAIWSHELGAFPIYWYLQTSNEHESMPPFYVSSDWNDSGYFSSFDCRTSTATNQHGVPFAIRSCLRVYGQFHDRLYDAAIRAISLVQAPKVLSFKWVFRGFSEANIRAMTSSELNAVERVGGVKAELRK